MIELNEKLARSVASKTRIALMDLDRAFSTQLRLTAEAVETISGSGVAAGQSQKLLRSFHSGAGKLIEGRSELVSAIGQLQLMQRSSNLAETDWGCAGPWALNAFTTHSATTPAVDVERGLAA